MSDRVLVLIATSDAQKALVGLMYAKNALKHGWMEDVAVIFFGASEKMVLEDERVRAAAKAVMEYKKPLACKAVSDHDQTSGALEELGFSVEYVGQAISRLIKQGYAPMVF